MLRWMLMFAAALCLLAVVVSGAVAASPDPSSFVLTHAPTSSSLATSPSSPDRLSAARVEAPALSAEVLEHVPLFYGAAAFSGAGMVLAPSGPGWGGMLGRVPRVRSVFWGSLAAAALGGYLVLKNLRDGLDQSSLLLSADPSPQWESSPQDQEGADEDVASPSVPPSQGKPFPPLLAELPEGDDAAEELLPQPWQRERWRQEMTVLLSHHQRRNDEDFYEVLAQGMLKHFLHFLDPSKVLFTVEDVRCFENLSSANWLVEMVHEGDFTVYDAVRERFVRRFREASQYLQGVVADEGMDPQLLLRDVDLDLASWQMAQSADERAERLLKLHAFHALIFRFFAKKNEDADVRPFFSHYYDVRAKYQMEFVGDSYALILLKEGFSSLLSPHTRLSTSWGPKSYHYVKGLGVPLHIAEDHEEILSLRENNGWLQVASLKGAPTLQQQGVMRPGDVVLGISVGREMLSTWPMEIGYFDFYGKALNYMRYPSQVFSFLLLRQSSDGPFDLIEAQIPTEPFSHVHGTEGECYRGYCKKATAMDMTLRVQPFSDGSNGRVFVLRMPSFDPGTKSFQFEDVLEWHRHFLQSDQVLSRLLEEMEVVRDDHSALILDLRGNRGGYFTIARILLAHLGVLSRFEVAPYEFDFKYFEAVGGRYGRAMARLFKDSDVADTMARFLNHRIEDDYAAAVVRAGMSYQGPVVVLFDADTASASEVLIHEMLFSGRAITLGSGRTSGKTVGGVSFVSSPLSPQGELQPFDSSKHADISDVMTLMQEQRLYPGVDARRFALGITPDLDVPSLFSAFTQVFPSNRVLPFSERLSTVDGFYAHFLHHYDQVKALAMGRGWLGLAWPKVTTVGAAVKMKAKKALQDFWRPSTDVDEMSAAEQRLAHWFLGEGLWDDRDRDRNEGGGDGGTHSGESDSRWLRNARSPEVLAELQSYLDEILQSNDAAQELQSWQQRYKVEPLQRVSLNAEDYTFYTGTESASHAQPPPSELSGRDLTMEVALQMAERYVQLLQRTSQDEEDTPSR